MGGATGTQPGDATNNGGNGTTTAAGSMVGVPSTLGLFAAVAASFLL